jgi:hypothetical protein
MVKSVFRYLHFLRSYKHLQVQFCRRPYWIQWDNVIHACNFLSAEVKVDWRYTSNFLTCIHGAAGNNCTCLRIIYLLSYYLWLCSPPRAMASSFTRFLDHTQQRATAGRTPLDERSARRRDFYLATHTTDKQPCPRWVSNPGSQQASNRRTMP